MTVTKTNERKGNPMSLHCYSPTFPTNEMQGSFSFDNITFDQALDILAHGEWTSRETGKPTPIAKRPNEPLNKIFWHTTWPSIRHMLNRNGFRLSNQIDRRGEGAGGGGSPMAVGDTGVILRPINKPDLKSKTLTQADFVFIQVTRDA